MTRSGVEISRTKRYKTVSFSRKLGLLSHVLVANE